MAIVLCSPLFCDPHKALVGLARVAVYPSISADCAPLLSLQQIVRSPPQSLRPIICPQRQKWPMIRMWWSTVSSVITSFWRKQPTSIQQKFDTLQMKAGAMSSLLLIFSMLLVAQRKIIDLLRHLPYIRQLDGDDKDEVYFETWHLSYLRDTWPFKSLTVEECQGK